MCHFLYLVLHNYIYISISAINTLVVANRHRKMRPDVDDSKNAQMCQSILSPVSTCPYPEGASVHTCFATQSTNSPVDIN